MIVRIARYFPYPDLVRQTPNKSFQWNDITFTEEEVEECDYLVVLDYPGKDVNVRVNPDNIIHLSLEPCNEYSKYRHYANKKSKHVYSHLVKPNSIQSHGALPWHIDKDYDYLKALKPSSLEKEDVITWVTSNQRGSIGHQKRMAFFDAIEHLPYMRMYGRGIKPIDSKWDVLQNSKYAIAYENFDIDYYWTEKISDCFLTYTVPIYVGSKSISQYFPEGSYIQIDPNDKHIETFFSELLQSNRFELALDAVTQARNLVLDEYQLFPFLYKQIKALEAINGIFAKNEKEQVFLPKGDTYFDNYPTSVVLERIWRKTKKKIKL